MSAYDLVASRPWAITEEGFRLVVAVASRDSAAPEVVRALEARKGEPLDNTFRATVRDGVATIPVRGPIFRHANLLTRLSGATSTAQIATDFQAAIDDPAVRAVILDVDSPGGEAAGVGELAGLVRSARGRKPIVAYADGAMCSAAYWVASAADRVVASPSAIVGSIGALVQVDRRADGEKEPITIVSSQSPEKYHDPESRKGQDKIQAVVDELAAVFVDDVARNRGVSAADVLDRYGKGGVFVGRAALAAGLVDALGSLESLHAELAASAPAKPTNPGRRPAPSATASPKGSAMSAENETPQAGDANAELEALRRQLAQANADKAEALAREKAAVTAKLEGLAEKHVAKLEAVLTPFESEGAKAAFLQAALDDHASPIDGKPSARLDALAAAYGGRKPHNLTREVGASDSSHEPAATRRLGMDAAQDGDVNANAAREERRRRNHEALERRQGKAI